MKRLITSVLAICLFVTLAVPARAFNAGSVGTHQTLSGGMAIIDNDGVLWMCGSEINGHLGNGFRSPSIVPTPVRVMENVVSVNCGAGFTAAIKADGSLWMWGDNCYGQLGFEGGNSKSYSYVVEPTDIQTVPVKVMENVAAVSCGSDHTAAIKTDGSLWIWGKNEYGELGDGTMNRRATPAKVMEDVASVCCGIECTAAIKTDGSLWMWGNNSCNQLGFEGGNEKDPLSWRFAQIEIINVQTVPVKVMENVAAVSCDSYHTAAIKTDGSLWTWGSNAHGVLGDGTPELRTVIGRKADNFNQTVDGTWTEYVTQEYDRPENHAPAKVMENVAAVSCGGFNTMAIQTDGSLWIWGDNTIGQLGNGTATESYCTKPVKLMDNVAEASAPNAVVKFDGSIWTWGSNEFGALGYEGGNAKDQFGNIIQTVPKQISGIKAAVPARAIAAASPTSSTVLVNGVPTAFDAFNIGGNNYFKLRDVAQVLRGTEKQFEVTWDEQAKAINLMSGKPYTSVGGELAKGDAQSKTARLNRSPIYKDGKAVTLTAYNIGGNNYFKLRDLGIAFDFDVSWDGAQNTIGIDTSRCYTAD